MNIRNLRKTYYNPSITMKLKSSIAIALAVVVLLFWGGITNTQAQGIFNTQPKAVKTDNTDNTQSKSGGIFRDGGWDEGDPGDGGTVDNPDTPGDEPVGEGILILSLLSGAYALVKRNVKRKNEV